MPAVTLVVEGDTDVPFARKLLDAARLDVSTIIDMGGKPKLDRALAGYNAAAKHSGWFILRDLDQDAPCAPALVSSLLPTRSNLMCLRIPVRAIESWALGDSTQVAAFFKLREGAIPVSPELEPDPKRRLVDLVRKSTSKAIRDDCLPAAGASRKAGPGYEARLIEFGTEHWRLREAQKRCPSLQRCLQALRQLQEALAGKA